MRQAAYLTIDDGPSEHTLERLRLLRQYRVPAIWFCLGENLVRFPEYADAILADGHILANHSFGHPRFSDITLDTAREEVMKTERLIHAAYSRNRQRQAFKLFRFPYGDPGASEIRTELQSFLRRNSYTAPALQGVAYAMSGFRPQPASNDWLWSWDMNEWTLRKPSYDAYKAGFNSLPAILNKFHRLVATLEPSATLIILTHDHPETIDMFKPIIETLTDRLQFRAYEK